MIACADSRKYTDELSPLEQLGKALLFDRNLSTPPGQVLDPQEILTDQEYEGLVEFREYCARCHVSTEPGPGGTPPLFTDYSFENIGVPKNPQNPFYTVSPEWNPDGADFVDYGLGGFLKKAGFAAKVD